MFRLLAAATPSGAASRTAALLVLALGGSLLIGTAHAQFVTTPDIYGHPEYGTTTTGPHGQTWHTDPDIYGHPEFGTTTTGPHGARCTSTPNIYGHPESGVTTHCN